MPLLLILGCVSCGRGGSPADDGTLSSLEDLKGKKVGVILGSTADVLLSKDADVQVMRYNSPAVIFQSVELKKIDAALLDSATTINASLMARGIEMAFGGVEPAEACMGFRYDESELCNSFNEYLASAKADGSYQAILDKWTTGNVDGLKMPEYSFSGDAEPLNIGIMSEDVPFAFVNAEGFAGVEPELLNAFAQYIGRRPVYHEYEFASLAAGLQTGRVDVICALMFNTPERAKTILFSDSYFQSANVCLVPQETAGERKSFVARVKDAFYNNLIFEKRYRIIFEGLWTTLVISFFSILLGTVLGALMAWRSRSKRKKLWHGILKVYGAIMHGVPLLVLLMMMFYVVFASSRLSAVWISIITFAIYFGYASCEIFNSGIDAVGKGQNEAARSLGFTKFGAFRYVVLPQAIKRIVPFYEGEAVTLIKETCLVGFIAVVDLTKATDIIQSRTFDAFFPLIIAAAIYFVIAWLLSVGLKCLTAKKQAVK
ncbi:MAG: ABC transporter substrate-binding protein/permease [Bacteroidia bacterium]|nr:ABC transporter substrate-binding protein/permease [Bacteroidia bacterium]